MIDVNENTIIAGAVVGAIFIAAEALMHNGFMHGSIAIVGGIAALLLIGIISFYLFKISKKKLSPTISKENELKTVPSE